MYIPRGLKIEKEDMYIKKEILEDFEIDYERLVGFFIQKYDDLFINCVFNSISLLLSEDKLSNIEIIKILKEVNNFMDMLQDEMEFEDYLVYTYNIKELLDIKIIEFEDMELYEQCYNIHHFLKKSDVSWISKIG